MLNCSSLYLSRIFLWLFWVKKLTLSLFLTLSFTSLSTVEPEAWYTDEVDTDLNITINENFLPYIYILIHQGGWKEILIIYGILRILLGHILRLWFFFIEKTDMTLPNRVIFKFSGHLWPDGQVYSMYDWNWGSNVQ